MKTRFVVVLLVLNVAVLAAGYVCFSQYWGAQSTRNLAAAQSELDAWKAKAARPVLRGPPFPPVIVRQTNDFRWSQLESTDYRKYIANLRAVGCPESTLRDIILTDVMRLYAQRRGQYSRSGRPFKFWETNEKRKLKQPQIEERDRQLAAIDKELPAVLRELLGINYEREMNKFFVDADEDDDRLGFLSEDKRDQVLSLRDQFEGKRERILYNVQNGKPSASEIDQLRRIDQEQDDALAQVLGPQEKEDYELSTSATADQLRQQLIGFNPTEQEFRDLYNKQKAIDKAYAYEDTNDPSVSEAKAAEMAAMTKQFKDNLTGDRVAQWDRAQNPDYRDLSELAERFDLPGDAPQTMLDMQQAVEEERQKLLANKDIPPERVEVALQAIQAETQKAALEALGQKAYDQYSQSAAWLKNTGTN